MISMLKALALSNYQLESYKCSNLKRIINAEVIPQLDCRLLSRKFLLAVNSTFKEKKRYCSKGLGLQNFK
jgi:hypothetical protein